MSWKHWAVIFIFVALIFPVIGMALKSHNKQVIQSHSASDVAPQAALARDQARPVAASPNAPDECFKSYATGSSVANLQLIREMCESAFDPTKHPIYQARSLCTVATWHEKPSSAPFDVSHECDKLHPLPPCPSGMEFDLHNMRCEVSCDLLNGYAPDETGKACYLACPDGNWPIYAGTVLECNGR